MQLLEIIGRIFRYLFCRKQIKKYSYIENEIMDGYFGAAIFIFVVVMVFLSRFIYKNI
jgi:hypothetical protein